MVRDKNSSSFCTGYRNKLLRIVKIQNMRNVLTSIGFVTNFDFNDKNVILNFREKTYEKTRDIKKAGKK